MKNIALCFVLLFGLSGCASWREMYHTDPVGALTRDVSYIQTAASLARGAFEMFAGVNPEAAATARPQFTSIMFRVDAGLRAAQDGLRIAVAAGRESPDVGELISAARSAISDLNSLLVGLPGNEAGRSSGPEMREAIAATAAAARH